MKLQRPHEKQGRSKENRRKTKGKQENLGGGEAVTLQRLPPPGLEPLKQSPSQYEPKTAKDELKTV